MDRGTKGLSKGRMMDRQGRPLGRGDESVHTFRRKEFEGSIRCQTDMQECHTSATLIFQAPEKTPNKYEASKRPECPD